MKTYAPSSTNRLAVAKPMPVEPPVINAVLSFRSAMIMPFARYFHSWTAFFAIDEGGHAWTFLGGHLLNGPTSRVMAVRTLTTQICRGAFEARTTRPFPARNTTHRAAPTQCCASDEHY